MSLSFFVSRPAPWAVFLPARGCTHRSEYGGKNCGEAEPEQAEAQPADRAPRSRRRGPGVSPGAHLDAGFRRQGIVRYTASQTHGKKSGPPWRGRAFLTGGKTRSRSRPRRAGGAGAFSAWRAVC